VLHAAGLSQRQINAIIPKWNEIVGAMGAAEETKSQTAMAEGAAKLKTEWGAAYDAKVGLAQGAIKHYADSLKLGDDVMKELDGTKLGNSPALAKLFAHLGSQLKEDGLLGKASGATGGELSPAEAKQQIAAMEADKDQLAALRDKRHPKHAETLAKRTALFEMAFPPPPQEGAA
jgi:hypothetical protein